ncbi:MAG: adenylosuccinate lyase [Planctomycetes bacterium]|nr:adenylosuccinate lyase [Planctomycetota bacterium]
MSDDRHDRYESPLASRYASEEMLQLFSARCRALLWRDLWIALAEAERELGLPVTDAQIAELRAKRDVVDFEAVRAREATTRHEVMAHLHAYGAVAPGAAPILHLGATSAYVMDNGDLLQLRSALGIVRRKVLNGIAALRDFAATHRALPCLAYTHFQPAQLTTVGKRACLWAQDLLLDLEEIDFRVERLAFLGAKGATGTQASFLQLFDGDHAKVVELDRLVTKKLGFARAIAVSGQTYPRKVDAAATATLAGLAASASKFAADVRLLSGLREIEEPFGDEQVGSSAMAYKQNPMRSERITALARFVMVNSQNLHHTAANQWFERTLDDSANRRLAIPESFLATDALLILYLNVARGLRVHPAVIDARVRQELPFMATEGILMEAVKAGGNRQEVHERIRVHSKDAAERLKGGAADNDLLARLAADAKLAPAKKAIAAASDPRLFVGRAPEQVDEFLRESVDPVLKKNRGELGLASDLRV